MLDQGTNFARYSKNLCWIVSFIGLLLSIFAFTGDSGNAVVGGFLWLALAFAFAISAIFLSKREENAEVASTTDQSGGE